MSAPRRGARATRLGAGGADGEAFDVVVDGEPLRAWPGESIATVLLTAGRRALRETARRREPRGLYCVMGVCWECAVRVHEGAAAGPVHGAAAAPAGRVRACVTLVERGMRIETRAT